MRVLFLSTAFLEPRRGEPMRGVQLFDLALARDLAIEGVELTIGADPWWIPVLRDRLGASARIIRAPIFGKPMPGALWTAARALVTAPRFDVLLLGNPARGLMPGARLLHAARRFDRCVVLAHKSARPAVMSAIARLPSTLVAVNDGIRREFEAAMPGRAHTYYGITNAGAFTPRTGGARGDGFVHFGLVGRLNNPWKGADTALAAFRAMDPAIRARCRLHLAAFDPPRAIDEPGVVVHPWIEAGAMPEFLRTLDAVLVPSTSHETFSQAAVQAMLAGLPLLTSALPVLAEKAEDGAGIICADEQAFARAMERLASNPAEREAMGRAARGLALRRYVWDTRVFIDRYLAASPASAPSAARAPA